MGEKLKWDSVSPITNQPLTWDQPGATWGGSWPDPPKPETKKKKPFHRHKNPNPPPQPPPSDLTLMSNFLYNTRQKSTGGFTTSVVLHEPVPDSTLLGLIATRASTTPEIAEAVLRSFVAEILACGSGCLYTRKFLGLLAIQPTSGGSATNPADFHNAQDINADISISIIKEVIDNWQGTLTLQHMGELGKITPIIDSMINQATGALNIYTAGNLMQVRGNNLKFDRSDPLQGIFLTDAAGVEVHCTVYADIEPQSFTFLVPTGTTGAQTVRMAAFINGSVRSYTYSANITAA
jgi:hypothetical protein